MSRLSGNYYVSGELRTGSLIVNNGLLRSSLALESATPYPVPLETLRTWDAYGTNLPATSANDDLGLYGGTFGADAPAVKTSDLKTAGATTRYARFTYALPAEYVAGGAVSIRLHAGMITAVADTTATVDIECYKSDGEADVGSDLCTTAAQSINDLTFADKDFVITPTGFSAGDVLDVRITVAVNDGAGAAAVIACVGAIEMLLTIRG